MITLSKGRHGCFYHYSTDNTIGQSLARYGEWAESEIFFLSKFIQPGDLVLDIGANVGSHTMAFARFVGPSGRVIAFDAQPKIYALLSANLAVNGIYWADALNALVAQDSRIEFVDSPDVLTEQNFGAVSFRKVETKKTKGNLLPISQITIDSLELERCNLIKIDVEGMELDVFKGASHTIDRHRPIVYYEETGILGIEERADFYLNRDYDLFLHLGSPYNINNFNRDKFNIFGDASELNVLAIPKERKITINDARAVDSLKSLSGIVGVVPIWSLPKNAYADLLPVYSSRKGGGRANVRRVLLSYRQFDLLQQQFKDLLEDRKKAQDIMEHQARELSELRK